MKIIVTGPGRCGSSRVARLLHEEMYIFMGQFFREPDDNNPQGFYEDLEFRDLNESILSGTFGYETWCFAIKRLINDRNKSHKKWGFKDPRVCHLIEYYTNILSHDGYDVKYIRCHRNHTDTVSSMSRCYNWSRERSSSIYNMRESMLNEFLPLDDTLLIDLDKGLSDGEIVKEIQQWLN